MERNAFCKFVDKCENEFDYSKAKEELGYTTRPYAETIHDEVVWLKEAGLI